MSSSSETNSRRSRRSRYDDRRNRRLGRSRSAQRDDRDRGDNMIRTDCMVGCWIINSMKESIVTSFMNVVSAAQLWQELNERFGENNEPLAYQLRRNLANLTQGTDSLVDYFGKMKTIWDDIRSIDPIVYCHCAARISCNCEILKHMTESDNKNRILDFLLGLNDAFEAVKGQILSMDSVNTALFLLFVKKSSRLCQLMLRESPVVFDPGGFSGDFLCSPPVRRNALHFCPCLRDEVRVCWCFGLDSEVI